MVVKQRINHFDINSLIQKGKSDVREFELPIGTMLYRPLTSLEIQEADAYMIDAIQDVPTREYVFNKAEKAELPNKEDVEKKKFPFPPDVSVSEFFKAMCVRDIRIVAMAIRDFTDDFDEDDLIRIEGIDKLAIEILRVSGNTNEIKEDIKNFR